MALWLAAMLTLAGSSLMNAGVVLMKKGTMELPADRRQQLGMLRAYSVSLKGWLGLGLNGVGAGLYLTALSAHAAPISLLQPLATFGLVVNAVLAVLYLGERLNAPEWIGVFLLFVGVICLGVSAESPPPGQALLHLPRWLGYLSVLGILGLGILAFLQLAQKQIIAEVLYGLLAGLFLGAGYLNAKTSALAWHEEHVDAFTLALVITTVGLLGGFWILLRGYYRGRALIVKSTNFVTSQVVIGVGEIFCLGESFPKSPLGFWARSAAYALILAGFLALAGFHAAGARSQRSGVRDQESGHRS